MGSSRWPRSTRTASSMCRGRPQAVGGARAGRVVPHDLVGDAAEGAADIVGGEDHVLGHGRRTQQKTPAPPKRREGWPLRAVLFVLCSIATAAPCRPRGAASKGSTANRPLVEQRIARPGRPDKGCAGGPSTKSC